MFPSSPDFHKGAIEDTISSKVFQWRLVSVAVPVCHQCHSPPASYVFAKFLPLCKLSSEPQWHVNNAYFGEEFLDIYELQTCARTTIAQSV